MKSFYLTLFFACFFILKMNGQGVIRLENPSFELGKKECRKAPEAWRNAGTIESQAPNTQPKCGKLDFAAHDGKHFLSLVTRSNGSRQGIRQKLPAGFELEKGQEYGFSLFLAKAKILWEVDSRTGGEKLCDQPAVLQIWGTNKSRSKRELLAESQLVKHPEWRKYSFLLKPVMQNWSAIELIVAFDSWDAVFNGHVLVDDCQPIVRIKDNTSRDAYDDPESKRPFSVERAETEKPKQRPKIIEWHKSEVPNYPREEPSNSRKSYSYPRVEIEKEMKYGGRKIWPASLNYDSNLIRGAEIKLLNPSFEELPKCCQAPFEWDNCGHYDESPTDIQPGYFSCSKKARNGDTYLGMVIRDNETSEAIGQKLSSPLYQGKTYEFEVSLARSERYVSMSRATGEEVNYTTPAVLEIWAGNKNCENAELLVKTELIGHTTWIDYILRFSPQKGNFDHIKFRIAPSLKDRYPYNGNILVDNCSPIYEMIEKK